ncbi:MAG: CD0415/CD1112 family protein [Defluviitaleaceae bacterium]|nr:CD0415/CD1112 family protein [Defluviitaleaceae bacterium]
MRWIIDIINDGVGGVISDWLIDGIISNVENAFVMWEDEIAIAADTLTITPEDFLGCNPFNLLQTLSDNIILPVAVVIFGLIVAYEFMSMLSEGNNFRDFDYTHLFKWLAKVVIGAFLLTNVFPIVNWIFEVGVSAVTLAEGHLTLDLIDFEFMFEELEDALRNDYTVGTLANIWMVSFLLGLFMVVSRVAIIIIVLYRMFLIILKISLAPMPFATLINREWGNIGTNYIKTLTSTAFQGFLMMVILGMYGFLMMTFAVVPTSAMEVLVSMLEVTAYSVMLIILLIKTQQISKSIFGAN